MKGQAIFPVSTPKSSFGLEGSAGRQRCLPLVHELRKVVGMNYAGPSPSQKVIQRNAQIFQPAFVEKIQIAVGTSAVQHRGSCIDHELEAVFTSAPVYRGCCGGRQKHDQGSKDNSKVAKGSHAHGVREIRK